MLLLSWSQGSFFLPSLLSGVMYCVLSISPFTERRGEEAVLPFSLPFYHCGAGIQAPKGWSWLLFQLNCVGSVSSLV